MRKYYLGVLITLSALAVIFHLLVLANVIPYTMVWGGRITDENAVLPMEIASIATNLVILFFLLSGGRYIPIRISFLTWNIFLWIMVVLFTLNTIGNFASLSTAERNIFAPITFLNSFLCFMLAITEKRPQAEDEVKK